MPQLLIRNLDAETVNNLKSRARTNGRSLEAELRLILTEAAGAGVRTTPVKSGMPKAQSAARTFALPAPARSPEPEATPPRSAEPLLAPELAVGLPPFSPDLLPTASPEAAAKFAAMAREHGLDFSDEDGAEALTRLMQREYLLVLGGPPSDETCLRGAEYY